MKICAQNPINAEYTLCGDAFDAPETESDVEPFEFGVPGDRITCDECRRAIAFVYEIYTPGGKVK